MSHVWARSAIAIVLGVLVSPACSDDESAGGNSTGGTGGASGKGGGGTGGALKDSGGGTGGAAGNSAGGTGGAIGAAGEDGGETACGPVPVDAPADLAKPPGPRTPGACNEADLTALGALVDGLPGIRVDEYRASHAACAACALSESDDSSWGVVIVAGGFFINEAACVAAVTGDAVCAAKYAEKVACVFTACGACTSSPEYGTCVAKVVGSGAFGDAQAFCKPYVNAPAGCAADFDGAADACALKPRLGETAIAHARVVCGSDSDAGDAGSDVTTDAGPDT